MTVHVSFLTALALAGVAFLVGEFIVRRVAVLRRFFLPEPLVGGLLFALGLLLLRLLGMNVVMPSQGYPVDWLVTLLTTNMGLHVTWGILKKESGLFVLFLTAGAVLYFVHLFIALPVALAVSPHPLAGAITLGPLAYVGAPFNLNPPNQVPVWFARLLVSAWPQYSLAQIKPMTQGEMMTGVVIGIFLTGVMARFLFKRAHSFPPRPDPDDRQVQTNLWTFTRREVALVVLIVGLAALSFIIQGAVLGHVSWMSKNYLPTIVIGYFLGITFRLLWQSTVPQSRREFPQGALTVLLLGPTMGLVLTYAVMVIPLYNLRLVQWYMPVVGLLFIAASVLVAWGLYPIFARLTDHYYAATIAALFLGITTAWGPISMSYLRRFTDEQGPIPVMPVILPLNAFFLFPWTVMLLSKLLLHVF